MNAPTIRHRPSNRQSAPGYALPKSSSVALYGEATVVTAIAPGQTGRVRYRASEWPALGPADLTLLPGDRVEVLGNQSILLLVTPLGAGQP